MKWLLWLIYGFRGRGSLLGSIEALLCNVKPGLRMLCGTRSAQKYSAGAFLFPSNLSSLFERIHCSRYAAWRLLSHPLMTFPAYVRRAAFSSPFVMSSLHATSGGRARSSTRSEGCWSLLGPELRAERSS